MTRSAEIQVYALNQKISTSMKLTKRHFSRLSFPQSTCTSGFRIHWPAFWQREPALVTSEDTNRLSNDSQFFSFQRSDAKRRRQESWPWQGRCWLRQPTPEGQQTSRLYDSTWRISSRKRKIKVIHRQRQRGKWHLCSCNRNSLRQECCNKTGESSTSHLWEKDSVVSMETRMNLWVHFNRSIVLQRFASRFITHCKIFFWT